MRLLVALVLFLTLSGFTGCSTASPVPRPRFPICIVNEDATCICHLDGESYEVDCVNHLAVELKDVQEMIRYEKELVRSCKEWK